MYVLAAVPFRRLIIDYDDDDVDCFVNNIPAGCCDDGTAV
jgi:hypothetical protein